MSRHVGGTVAGRRPLRGRSRCLCRSRGFSGPGRLCAARYLGRAGCLRDSVGYRWRGSGAARRRRPTRRRAVGPPRRGARVLPGGTPLPQPRGRLVGVRCGSTGARALAYRTRRAAPFRRTGGPSSTLLEEEEPQPADHQDDDCGGQHDRKPVDQRVRDIDGEVPQGCAVLLRDQALAQRYADEQDQRRLHDGGEEGAVAGSHHGEDAAEEIERRERRGEFAPAGRIGHEPETGDSDGQKNDTPPGETGNRPDNRLPIERHPGASTLGCRHTTTVAATCRLSPLA